MVNNNNLNAKIDVDAGAAVRNVAALEKKARELDKAFKDGNVSAAEYGRTQAALATAIQRSQKTISDARQNTARNDKTNAEAEFTRAKTRIALAEGEARAVARAEKAKRDERNATDKAAKTNQNAIYAGTLSADKAGIKEKNRSQTAIYDQYLKDQSRYYKEQDRLYKSYLTSQRANVQEEQRLSKEAAKARKEALVDRNPGATSQLPAGYLAAKAVGLPTQDLSLPDIGQLNQTRYALYDVATTLGIFGAALTGAGAAAVGFATNYEKAFTQVERTTLLDKNSAQLGQLRDDLISLSEDIPVGFENLSSVAALGAQLGIASEDLTSFTETAAQFAAVTGVGTDQVAQSFGALGELLNVNADQFQNLGSAINYTGVRSVATDAEILALATSIGASATQAGFAADETVGLASALASLRIQPEQARGVILRLFSDFDQVVSEGGAKLETYSKVLGTTTDNAKELWDTDPEQFFDQLLKGLSTADDLNGTLRDLGITETRESNVLQRLAGNYNVYTSAMQDANAAYESGSFLGESYAKVQDDIASRLQILINAIQNLIARAGEGLIPILGPVLDVALKIVQAFEQIPAPILGLITAATLLAGTFALVVAGGAALIASALAMRTVIVGLRHAAPEATTTLAALRAVVADTSRQFGLNAIAGKAMAFNLGQLTVSGRAAAAGISSTGFATRAASTGFTGAAVSARAFGTALLATPVVNVVAALSLLIPVLLTVAEGFQDVSEANAEAGKSLLSAGGGFEAFYATLGSSGTGFRDIKINASEAAVALQEDAKAAADTADNIANLTGVTGGAADAANGTTDAIRAQTLALTDNSTAWILNALRQNADENGLADIAADPAQLAAFQKYGIDIEAAIAEGFGKEGGVGKALQEQLTNNPAYQELIANGGGSSGAIESALFGEGGIDAFQTNLEKVGAGVDGLYGQLQITGGISAALGLAPGAGDIDAVNGQLEQMTDLIAGLFSGLTAEADFLDAMDAIKNSLEENGSAFDNFSAGGRANLAALQTALQTASVYGAQLGLSAEDSMAQALVSIGADSSQIEALMRSLAQSNPTLYASLNIDDVLSKYNTMVGLGLAGSLGLAAAESNLNRLKSQRDALQSQIKTSSGGGGGGGRKGGGGSSAKKAQSEVKTLKEYVGDLSTAMKEAFDRQFGIPQAMDDVAEKFNSIAENVQKAKDNIRDLNADLNELAADRAKLQAQLVVAEDYGDTTRAGEIRSALGKNENSASDKRGELANATAASTLTLEGNTKAAIDNRSAILGLVGSYQAQIEAYAATGASAAQISAYTSTLQTQFVNQATQLGFNATAVNQYASVFGLLSSAVAAVPTTKQVNVTADVSGAMGSLNSVGSRISSLSGQLGNLNAQIAAQEADVAKLRRAQPIIDQINSLNTQLKAVLARSNDSLNGQSAQLTQRIYALNQKLASGNYARGGVVGGQSRATSKYHDNTTINAQVGEGVVTLDGMKFLGAAGLDALNSQQNPFPQQIIIPQTNTNAGSSSSYPDIVQLDTYERSLLQDVVSAIHTLKLSGAWAQNVVNSGNATTSRLGGSA